MSSYISADDLAATRISPQRSLVLQITPPTTSSSSLDVGRKRVTFFHLAWIIPGQEKGKGGRRASLSGAKGKPRIVARKYSYVPPITRVVRLPEPDVWWC
jgi:hypothetical protein